MLPQRIICVRFFLCFRSWVFGSSMTIGRKSLKPRFRTKSYRKPVINVKENVLDCTRLCLEGCYFVLTGQRDLLLLSSWLSQELWLKRVVRLFLSQSSILKFTVRPMRRSAGS